MLFCLPSEASYTSIWVSHSLSASILGPLKGQIAGRTVDSLYFRVKMLLLAGEVLEGVPKGVSNWKRGPLREL
jgi:hypothetical protein